MLGSAVLDLDLVDLGSSFLMIESPKRSRGGPKPGWRVGQSTARRATCCHIIASLILRCEQTRSFLSCRAAFLPYYSTSTLKAKILGHVFFVKESMWFAAAHTQRAIFERPLCANT
jgi:hypothetical protein